MARDCADWTKPLARSVYFSIFIRHFPRHAGATLKRRSNGIFIGFPRHRVDIPQPGAAVTDAGEMDHAGLRQMWEGDSGNGRGVFTNSCTSGVDLTFAPRPAASPKSECQIL